MKRSTILAASLTLAGVAALTFTGVAAWWTLDHQQTTLEPADEIERPDQIVDTDGEAAPDEKPQPTPVTDTTAREIAEPYEGPGTVDEPVPTCLTVQGRQVCDTFGESDEGPGTTTRPSPAPTPERAEPYEGPGTVDEPVPTCLTVQGREVCDTFGESDEGPGTS